MEQYLIVRSDCLEKASIEAKDTSVSISYMTTDGVGMQELLLNLSTGAHNVNSEKLETETLSKVEKTESV